MSGKHQLWKIPTAHMAGSKQQIRSHLGLWSSRTRRLCLSTSILRIHCVLCSGLGTGDPVRACSVTSVVFNLWWPHGLYPTGYSVHGILPTRILEWVAISSLRGSSPLRDRTCISCVSCTGRQVLYHWTTWEAYWRPPHVENSICSTHIHANAKLVHDVSMTWHESRVSQPHHYWHLGLDHSLLRGAALWIGGCLTTSLALPSRCQQHLPEGKWGSTKIASGWFEERTAKKIALCWIARGE